MEGPVRLELPNSIVRSYFSAALRSFHAMQPETDAPELRDFGLQSFLMSLTGLEAFTNVYFHRRGHTTGPPELIARANDRKPVEHKVSHLPRIAFGSNLPDQKLLNRKVRELYDLRSSIVHPRVTLSSMFFEGVAVSGMVQNFQQAFEDRELCREALRWCLLVVARIGIAAHEMGDMFVNYWTGITESDASLSEALGINPAAA
jgi:hypothetical protein